MAIENVGYHVQKLIIAQHHVLKMDIALVDRNAYVTKILSESTVNVFFVSNLT